MSTSTLKGVSALSALSSLSPHPLPCYRNRLRRLQECQHFTLDFDEDFDLHDSHPETPLYPVNPTQNSSLSSLSSTFNLQSSPSSSSSQPSPLSLSSSASASASSSSPGDSLPHDVDHFSFGPPFAPSPTPRPHPLGPTLKCIRNSLPLSLSESLAMKRYDRLSSSKSDLHLSPSSSVAESSVDEAESLDEKVTPLGKATSASRSSADLTLEVSGKSSSTLLESYSSTENIIPPSTSGSTRAISGCEEDHFRLPEGELWEGPSGNSGLTSGTSGVTLPSTNTFKSFIKTKTSSGIGIMRTGKDLHHHHGLSHGLHHRGGLEDDEEALQLCDSESTTSTVSSSHLKEVASATPTGSHLISGSSFSSSTSASSSVKGSSSAGAAASSAFHQINSSSSPLVTSASSATPTSVSSPAPPPLPSHQAIFLSNPCHSTLSNSTSCSCPSNGPSSTQTTLTSLDSTTSKQLAQLYQQQQASLGGQNLSLAQGEYLCPQTLLPPLSTQTPPSSGGKSRHLRSTLLPPLLKPNRFVKHSKGNLLFNVKSGHKSKSKQRLTEAPSKERLNSGTSGQSPSRNSEHLVESLKSDRLILTQPEEDRRRRTILIEKSNNSFGFTLQTYGIKHCREGEVELITYVDEVAYGGPAFRGGMRPGDVILSINGRDVEKADHRSLVTAINGCEKTMRLVVLFEDCVRKIELNIKYIKLKKALQQKVAQLEILNQRENQLLLNAALRHRGAAEESEKENLVNNNRLLPDSGVCQLKKYKCKSLDVSLDELNTVVVTNINNNNAAAYSTTTGPEFTGKSVESGHGFDAWPGLQSSIVTVDGKEYPTTLPRLGMTTAKGGPLALGDSEDEDDEDGLHLHGNGDEERRSLHKGARRKTSAGLVPVPVVIPVGGSGSSVQSSASSALRSKSLPHSVANSLDCLTNEAYEDDEDLLGQPETETDSKWKKGVVPTGVTTIITTGGSSSSIAAGMATHDKDFITKL